MLANGKLNNGDVYVDAEGDIRIYCKNTWDAWYPVIITKDRMMWVQEGRSMEHGVPQEYKFLLNIKDLLLAIKKDALDEPSN